MPVPDLAGRAGGIKMFDPTEPGHIPVYNLSDSPIPPPPPPPPGTQRYQIVFVIALLVVSIGGIMGGIIYTQQSATPIADSVTPITTPPVTPTPTQVIHSTLTPTPTTMPTTAYTAADLVRDFQEDPHLRLWYVHYGASISAWTSGDYPNPVESQSSATWGDISGCTGNCTPSQVGLWVYATLDDATAAYMDITNTTPVNGGGYLGVPVANVHGRCLLLGPATSSDYVRIMIEKCT